MSTERKLKRQQGRFLIAQIASSMRGGGASVIRGRWRRSVLVVALCFIGLWARSGAPRADVVYLKDGRRIEGSVVEDGDSVEIRRGDRFSVRFARDEVERIERTRNSEDVFEARFSQLRDGEIEPFVDLLVWAREQRLRQGVRRVAERLLLIDPHHPLGRDAMGYTVFENRWVLKSELRKRSDVVRHNGEWMTERERRRRDEMAARRDLEDQVDLLVSANETIVTWAVAELRRSVRQRRAVAIEVLAAHVSDRRVTIRVAVMALLRQLNTSTPPQPDSALQRAVATAVQALHRQCLVEAEETVWAELERTIASFQPRDSLQWALTVPLSESDATRIKRIERVLFAAVRKRWMPDLCRAARDSPARPAVRSTLRRILGEDHAHNATAWLRLWKARANDFHDVAVPGQSSTTRE